VTASLRSFLGSLHASFSSHRSASKLEVVSLYTSLAAERLVPFDRDYAARIPARRGDDSIFLSLASYRDENCLPTLSEAYAKSANPHKLFVGLVQQNCEAGCKTGVLDGGKVEAAPPDDDCGKLFCEARPDLCGQVTTFRIDEAEALGPYFARYVGSKLWQGESWYMQVRGRGGRGGGGSEPTETHTRTHPHKPLLLLRASHLNTHSPPPPLVARPQIDSHMTFLQDWDLKSVEMLRAAPASKPVLTHYPPAHDDKKGLGGIGPRICDPVIADSAIEAQIVRLKGAPKYVDRAEAERGGRASDRPPKDFSAAEAGCRGGRLRQKREREGGCRGETPRTPPAAGEGRTCAAHGRPQLTASLAGTRRR
jgi:hypothetical protein